MDAILALLGDRVGFDCGSFLVTANDKPVLRCLSFWSSPSSPCPNFEIVTRVREFSVNEGLPGTAWLAREPVWLSDLLKVPNFPRASVAEMDHINTGVAFPASLGKRVLGVFEFFSREHEPAQPELVRFFHALGGQIGVFLSHYRIADNTAAHPLSDEVRLVAETSSDAVITIDEDSNVLFANRAIQQVFGWTADELIGQKLMAIMPEYLRHVHEHAIKRYVETGVRHLDWEEINLPGLHKEGHEVPIRLAFGEFWRGGSRVFTGFARLRSWRDIGVNPPAHPEPPASSS